MSPERRLEKIIEETQDRIAGYRELFENASDMLFIVDVTPEQRFILKASNPASEEKLGIIEKEVVGKFLEEVFSGDQLNQYLERLRHCISVGTAQRYSDEYNTPSGYRYFQTILAPVFNDENRLHRIVGVSHDISELKDYERKLRTINWTLAALNRSTYSLIHAQSELELFQKCCEAITSDGSAYSLAFISQYFPESETIEIIAIGGVLADQLHISADQLIELAKTYKLTFQSFASGVTQVNNDLLYRLDFSSGISRYHGELKSGIAVALKVNNKFSKSLRTLNIYANERDAFGADEVKLLEAFAAELIYGIESRQMTMAYEVSIESQRKQEKSLIDAFETALGALANALQFRDPYTAGHQYRVADLASAIALRLGLAPFNIYWLRLAATVHDIGKIKIPAEILSKPSALTLLEYALLKEHPQTGYEILKDIDFPFPVATIVQQHHEYIDGSGYPLGLKGDDILQESRILTVADIVEAMSSHRPYRPAQGLDAALDEIRRMRGQQLDADVVDICMKLFKEEHYQFPVAEVIKHGRA